MNLSMKRTLNPTRWLAVSLALALGACTTVPDVNKDYTVKTVKMSPAPRDKFYKIVKVPKPMAPLACRTGAADSSPACDASRNRN